MRVPHIASLLVVLAVPAFADPGGTVVSDKQAAADELTAAVVTYPVTLAKLEAYAAAVKELRTTAEVDGRLRAALSEKKKTTPGLAATIAAVEAIKPLKEILDRHGVTGRDFVLMPTVMMSTQMAVGAEKGGHPMPRDRINSTAVALLKAEGPKVTALVQAFMADLSTLK